MDPDDDQLALYFRMSKNLIFSLPNEKDRIIAAKWIKKIEGFTDSSAKKVKIHVVELLLLCLQRKQLVGPFENQPSEDKEFSSYKWNLQPSDITSLILEKEFNQLGEPDMKIELSGDLCQYVAYQDIPNFGTHFFYASSPEKIINWSNLDANIIPKGLLDLKTLSSPDTSILKRYVDLKNEEKNQAKTSRGPTISHIHYEHDQRIEEENQPEDCFSPNSPEGKTLLAKLPPHLRARIAKSKELKKNKNLNRTPEIFRKDAHNIKYLRKYKPEEFLLTDDEQFWSASEIFRDLEYLPPENPRRSPAPKSNNQTKLYRDNKSEFIESNENDVADSFDRSFQRYHKETETINEQRFEPRKELLARLEYLKEQQGRRLVFDDIDVEIEPEEIAFERFVWSEPLEDVKDLTILQQSEMSFGDVFGEDQIANVSVLQSPLPIEELEKAEILLDREMDVNDIFNESKIAEPKEYFRDISVEKKVVLVSEDNQSPKQGTYRIGKRTIDMPGEKKMSQTYIEQTGNEALFNESLRRTQNQDLTPPINDSMLNKILEEKLQRFKLGKVPLPRTYGPWAEKFRNEIERLEKGEDLEENEQNIAQQSHISQPEMNADDLGGARHSNADRGLPSPTLKERGQEATQKYEKMKQRFEAAKAKKAKRKIDQDLLEPWAYETQASDQKGLLDQTNEDHPNLDTPLIKRPPKMKEKQPFESFEQRLDDSMKYFRESYPNESSQSRQQPNVHMDSDFLNRRILNEMLPNDASFMVDDEMAFEDIFGDEMNISEHMFNLLKDTKQKPTTQGEIGTEKNESSTQLSSVLQSSQNTPRQGEMDPEERLKLTLAKIKKNRIHRFRNIFPDELPYTQIENESFPNQFSNEAISLFLDETPGHQIHFANEMPVRTEEENSLDRHSKLIIKRNLESTKKLKNLRERYKILLAKQQNLKSDVPYQGTFERPFPNFSSPLTDDEVEEINQIFDVSERYDPLIKRFMPTERLEDQSLPEADFIGDEVLSPQTAADQSDQYQTQRTNRQYQTQPTNQTHSKIMHRQIEKSTCPSNRLPLNISPSERIKRLIEQQPQVEVIQEPNRSQFSPQKFKSRIVPKKDESLANESFPSNMFDPDEDFYEGLGDLAHALYIPHDSEDQDRNDTGYTHHRTPPRYSPNSRHIPTNLNVSNDILPHEQNFKWLDNYMPFEKQIRDKNVPRGPKYRTAKSQILTRTKVDIVKDKQKDNESVMKRTETLKARVQINPGQQGPQMKSRIKLTASGNLPTKDSLYIRQMTTGAIDEHGQSVIKKSSIVMQKDHESKCKQTLKENEVRAKTSNSNATKKYSFATQNCPKPTNPPNPPNPNK